MIPISNQPVYFGGEDECANDIDFAQIVDLTDTTQFQLQLEVCDGTPNEIANPRFAESEGWHLGGNWVIADNSLCYTAGTSDFLYSEATLDESKYYKVTIIVTSISFGAQFTVRLGAGGAILGSITTIGTYTFWGFPVEDLGITSVYIEPVVDGNICISEIDVYEVLLNLIVGINNLVGTNVAQISYADETSYFVLHEGTMTVTINWDDLKIGEGCYVICLGTPCENTNGQNYPAVILNCNFDDNADSWLVGSNWMWYTGEMSGTFSGLIREDNEFAQMDVFTDFAVTYCVLMEVTAMSGSFEVYFGTNLIQTITAVGAYTLTGMAIGNGDLTIRLTDGSARIDFLCPCDSKYLQCNYTSNTFKLMDTTGACTMVINACNNENGLGFVFGHSGFTPRIRLMAKLRQGKYASERNVYEDSVGKKSVVYFSGRKQKNLCVDLQPQYVLDFLRLLLGFDNVYLDGVAHVVDDDEFNVEWAETYDNIGKVRLLVSQKTQNVKNTNCTDTENSCIIAP